MRWYVVLAVLVGTVGASVVCHLRIRNSLAAVVWSVVWVLALTAGFLIVFSGGFDLANTFDAKVQRLMLIEFFGVAVASAIIGAILQTSRWERHRGARACPYCKFAFGETYLWRCPQCSRDVSWAQFSLTKECHECGYDLRGLTERRCPECGAEVRGVMHPVNDGGEGD